MKTLTDVEMQLLSMQGQSQIDRLKSKLRDLKKSAHVEASMLAAEYSKALDAEVTWEIESGWDCDDGGASVIVRIDGKDPYDVLGDGLADDMVGHISGVAHFGGIWE